MIDGIVEKLTILIYVSARLRSIISYDHYIVKKLTILTLLSCNIRIIDRMIDGIVNFNISCLQDYEVQFTLCKFHSI